MTVLDAQAVIALLRDEPAAQIVASSIASPAVLSALNAAEVMDGLVRTFGYSPHVVRTHMAELERAGVRVVPVTDELGIQAGLLRARYYHGRRRDISIADCVAAATALAEKMPVATSDAALLSVVRAEGGEVLPLPDQHGNMP